MKIFINQFLKSIQIFNISSELQLLNSFINLVGLNEIQHRLNFIQNDFYEIDEIFKRIIENNSQLSNQFLNKILNEVRLDFSFI